MVLQLLFILFFLLPSYVVVIYYLIFVMLRWSGCHDARQPAQVARSKFILVIPAHDEQLTIATTLRSCRRLNYPQELFDVVVVADNCTDQTEQIARDMGVQCLVRIDPDVRGKGAALAWALPQLMSDDHEAFMVLDADCPIDRNALRVLDRFLQDGEKILQANHKPSNPDASPISYAASVGRTLEYDLFFAPKSKLGMPVMLVGTGMVFHRSVLQDMPWSSQSCVEDTEFTLTLARNGKSICFASNAYVDYPGAETMSELSVQRTRWAAGNLSLSRSDSVRLIFEGLLTRNWRLLDLSWTLMILSRPLVLTHLLLVQITACLMAWLQVDMPLWMVIATIGLLPLYGIYLFSGIVTLGLNTVRIWHLLRTPVVVSRMALISLLALISARNTSWTRTPRQ